MSAVALRVSPDPAAAAADVTNGGPQLKEPPMGRPSLLLAAAIFLVPAQAGAQILTHLADGNDWKRSSIEQQRAYLAGVSNAISVGAAWDAKNQTGDEHTFSRTAQRALKHSDVEEAIRTVDAWYRANPSQLNKPVISVVWREIAKPQFPSTK